MYRLFGEEISIAFNYVDVIIYSYGDYLIYYFIWNSLGNEREYY